MAVLSKNILESLCLVHCCENSPGTSCLSFGGCASVQKLTAYCHAPSRFYTPTPSTSTPPVVLSHALLHLHAHLGPSSPSFRPPRAPPARWTGSSDPPTGPHTKYTRFFSPSPAPATTTFVPLPSRQRTDGLGVARRDRTRLAIFPFYARARTLDSPNPPHSHMHKTLSYTYLPFPQRRRNTKRRLNQLQ